MLPEEDSGKALGLDTTCEDDNCTPSVVITEAAGSTAEEDSGNKEGPFANGAMLIEVEVEIERGACPELDNGTDDDEEPSGSESDDERLLLLRALARGADCSE